MFGHNKVMVPKSYLDEPPDTLKVTSIFYTLQGEGPFSGTPCVFIRLTGCNLTCTFCDTYFDSGDTLTYDDIFVKAGISFCTFFTQRKIPPPLFFPKKDFLLVITGGEPLNQPNLIGFLEEAHRRGFKTQIESNGTIVRGIPGRTHLVISPKINERTGKHVLIDPFMLSRADTLKFVISKTMSGYQEIPEFALKWHLDKPGSLYLSPMNTYTKPPVKLGADGTLEGRSEVDERVSFWTPGLLDMKANQENHEWAAELALRYGCKLTLQTHLLASLP